MVHPVFTVRRFDAKPRGDAVGGFAVAKADHEAAGAGEIALELRGRQEDERLNEGHTAATLGDGLGTKERGEFLGLRVGKLEGIVGGGEPAVGLARPRTRIARDPPGPALDLDQKKSPGGEDEEIDLVYRGVEGDELED